jgi:hypothetical protein
MARQPVFIALGSIAPIELIGARAAVLWTFQIEMAVVDVAVQKDLPNTLSLVTRGMKALLLAEPMRRIRCSDAEYARMAHWSLTKSCEPSALTSR